eukprot:TRINITY_DN41671_c0_g1_i1.p1 TRINITY_DN41671_c0_g1~~TRINITY_DN41671_c0_g1_i1.p1  ORF type:complete len:236 (-),score=35.96 TRINITY_DN41671_c0_g1_i1:563-1270(-)
MNGISSKLRLIVSDLDGTLLDGEHLGGSISQKAKAALQQVVGDHCPLVLATARGLCELPCLDGLPGPLFLILYGGAAIMQGESEPQTGSWKFREISTRCLSKEEASAAVRVVREEQATVWLFQPLLVHVQKGDIGAKESDEWINKHVAAADLREHEGLEAVLAEDKSLEVVAVIPPDADAAASRISEKLAAGGIQIGVLSMAPDPMVSMKATGVDKARAVSELCQHLSVPLESVV